MLDIKTFEYKDIVFWYMGNAELFIDLLLIDKNIKRAWNNSCYPNLISRTRTLKVSIQKMIHYKNDILNSEKLMGLEYWFIKFFLLKIGNYSFWWFMIPNKNKQSCLHKALYGKRQ